MNDKLHAALEERKIIQDIIHNQEEIRMRLFGWCITIISGFTIAFHTEKIKLSCLEYGLLAISVVIIFLLLDIVNRAVFYKMIKRSRSIESMIQNNAGNYDGFRIEESMSEPFQKGNIKYDLRLFSPYIAMLLIVGVSYIAKNIIG